MIVNSPFRFLLLLLLSVSHVMVAQHNPLPKSKHGLVVIAHRGNHVTVPENTIASFKEAIRAGADYVEVDIQSTRDGVPAAFHDESLERMTGMSGRLSDLDWDDVRKLRLRKPDGTSKKRYYIPRFSEVLKTCKGKINIYLDFKGGDVPKIWEMIRTAGMEKQVAVYIGSVAAYREWKKIAPQVPVITSIPEQFKNESQLELFLGQVELEVLDNVTDPDLIALVQGKNIAVWTDVQSRDEGPEKWGKAIQVGVNGLQTDKPAALITYLNARNLRDGKVKADAAKPKPANYTTFRNVKYGDTEGPEHRFDAFVPKDHDEKTKVIVYIHGGSWSGGDKSEFPKLLVDELAGKRGYAVVSMNYRLVKDGRNLFPAQIEDVQKAIDKIASNGRKLKYDGNSIALIGASAGAHLAMLCAYGHNEQKRVKAVIDLWGPTDLTDKSVREDGTDANNTVVRFLGEADAKAKIAFDASPLHHLTGQTGVPTLIFHGAKDPLVHVSQAEKLYASLKDLNIPVQLEIYPEEKHGMSTEAAVDVFSKILQWLETYFPARE